jgi:hypothetical protein
VVWTLITIIWGVVGETSKVGPDFSRACTTRAWGKGHFLCPFNHLKCLLNC